MIKSPRKLAEEKLPEEEPAKADGGAGAIGLKAAEIFEKLQFLKTIGKGSFGRVFIVEDSTQAGKVLAVKVLDKATTVSRKHVQHTLNERIILGTVQHPFILCLTYAFQDPVNLYLAMEFCPGGELFTLIQRHKNGYLDEDWSKFYAAQVTSAFSYLHERHIVYRDLKPENILINADGYTKLADLGFAKEISETNITYTFCGTPEYMAPEMFTAERGYNKSVDYWALGVLIFEMNCGYAPFACPNGDLSKLMAALAKPKISFPKHFTTVLKTLLKHLLETDLTKRYGCMKNAANDIINSEWFKDVEFDKLYAKTIKPPYAPRIKGPADTSRFYYDTAKDDKTFVKQLESFRARPDPHAELFKDW